MKDNKNKPKRYKGFTFNDYVSKITITKGASNILVDALQRYDVDCDVVIKEK